MITENQNLIPAAPRRRGARRAGSDPISRIYLSGFTLVELMISIALALILLLGINQVFKITSDTVRAANALGDNVRNDRSIQSVFNDDCRAAVKSQPFITLDSFSSMAFRNRADEQGDKDNLPNTWDSTRSGTESQIDRYVTSDRNHRTDRFNFFASNLFRRQTGDDGVYVSSTTSNEAWINYSHLRVYDGGSQGEYALTGGSTGNGSYPLPGTGNAATNRNNFYASQWILGRVQMLLAENPLGENFIFRPAQDDSPPGPPHTITNPGKLSPLTFGSSSTQTPALAASPNPFQIQHHRLDLAGTSITKMREYAKERQLLIQQPQPDGTWKFPFEHWAAEVSYPFAANPFITRPAESRKMAQAAPVFVTGCTQFIVEFAGDFLRQDADGKTYPPDGVHTSWGDGTVDFIAEKVGSSPDRYTKTIRWYGLPRDTGSSVLSASAGRPDGLINPAFDVVPVRDLRIIGSGATTQSPFEKMVPIYSTNYTSTAAAAGSSPEYFCQFGPWDVLAGDVPLMIRITLTIDDPNGALTDGQSYEYVMKLGL